MDILLRVWAGRMYRCMNYSTLLHASYSQESHIKGDDHEAEYFDNLLKNSYLQKTILTEFLHHVILCSVALRVFVSVMRKHVGFVQGFPLMSNYCCFQNSSISDLVTD